MDDDPISNALQSRRLPHGRFKKRGTGSVTFNVFRAINEYEVTFGTGRSRARQKTSGDRKSFLIVHGLTPDEDGLFATMNFTGLITAVAVLGGSRKQLSRIINSFATLDRPSPRYNEDDGPEDKPNPDTLSDNDNNETLEEASNDDESSSLSHESSDDKQNRLRATFAKNSFRNPKFWLQWRGSVHDQPDTDRSSEHHHDEKLESIQTDMGYLVFADNSCQTFEGTITCKALNWNNVKIRGNRIKAMRNQTLDLESCQAAWLGGQIR